MPTSKAVRRKVTGRKALARKADKGTTRKSTTGKAAPKQAAGTVARQRRLQDKMEAKPAKPKSSKKGAVQAGTRRQPENPLPKQHLDKPGCESDLTPAPRYQAPDYLGSDKLDGRRSPMKSRRPSCSWPRR